MKHRIKLREKKEGPGDICTFYFDMDDPITWRAGQHGVFTIEGEDLGGRPSRTFTVASICSEECIMISTRICDPCSDYKRVLKSMEIGDTLLMQGPFGDLTIQDEKCPMLMLAGGIGITPFRALLLDLDEKNASPRAVQLLYSNSKGDFAYREELEQLVRKHDYLDVQFINKRESYAEAINTFTQTYGNDARYFLSGSPSFVKALKGNLSTLGITEGRIKNDPFYGYE